jgi:translation elongation factor EF-Tu-like GTPase
MPPFAFVDRFEEGAPRRVLARISFLSTEEGGRRGPCWGQYRPNHNFGGPDDRQFYIGQVQIPEGDVVRPGETRTLEVLFLNGPGLAECLQAGRRWRVQEGGKLVANAEVLEVHGEA